MNTRKVIWIVGASLALLALCRIHPLSRGSLVGPAPAPGPAQPEPEYKPLDYVLSADQAIRQLQERAKGEPDNPFNYLLLGQMYIRKARETGDFASYERAEAAVRRGLELDKNSLMGQATLAQVLCANHKFAEGLQLAQQV